jgi:chemotaxis protein histidine kinase CheA
MMKDKQMDFEKMMEELRAEYLAAMPQKFIDIGEHISKKDIAVLREDFHKLKGTGKTYGMGEISELGEVVEKICLTKNEQALHAAEVGLKLLMAIHKMRLTKKPFAIQDNAEFLEIKKLV